MSVEARNTGAASIRPGKAEQVAALARFAERAASATSLREVFRLLYEEASSVRPLPVFLLALYDEASQTVEVVRQIDRGEELPGGAFPLGSGFTSEAIRERRPVLIRQWSRDGRSIRVLYGTEQGDLVRPESSLTVPLIARDRVVGVISAQAYEPDAFAEEDVPFFGGLASVAAKTIDDILTLRGVEMGQRASALEAILASMADALLIVDANGALRRINREARELLSIAPDTIVMGQPVLVPDAPDRSPFGAREVAAALRGMFERLRQGESVRELEVEMRAGPLRVISLSASPLQAPDGTFDGAVIVMRDITSRHEVERLKDEMLSAAWHDLRTPITAIKGEAQLLRRRLERTGDDRDDLRRGLEIIDRQADRLHELVDTLLDASGIQLGRLQIERAPTDLVAIVRSVVEALRTASDPRRFRIEAPERCVGLWDGRRLRQVVENLVSNAVKYSPGGGEIVVSVEVDTGEATVRVRDQGMGMSAEEIAHAFERGWRGERVRSQPGSGLGLYICEAIVSAHGGRVWAASDGTGRGSTLSFSLPTSPAVV